MNFNFFALLKLFIQTQGKG